jgi:hypothetical protein
MIAVLALLVIVVAVVVALISALTRRRVSCAVGLCSLRPAFSEGGRALICRRCGRWDLT